MKDKKNSSDKRVMIMRIQRTVLESSVVFKYNKITARLGLSMRNVAYVMNVSTTYLSNILKGSPVSKHSISIFVMLLDFLNRVDYLRVRQVNEEYRSYLIRKKEKLEKMKKDFSAFLNRVSFY